MDGKKKLKEIKNRLRDGSPTSLFLELADPSEEGISRWIYIEKDFKDKFESLKDCYGNGDSLTRKNSVLYKNFEIEKKRGKSNKVKAVKLSGFKVSKKESRDINPKIRKKIEARSCPVTGSASEIEIDHKDGRYSNIAANNPKTQKEEHFQPLKREVNLCKREHCKRCKKTAKRFDARKLGFSVGWIKGDGGYRKPLGCEGCYWHDVRGFHSKISQKFLNGDLIDKMQT